MTAEEIVLGGYKNFAEGDMEGLGKIYHPNALIKVNGDHELSGDYHGFDEFLLIIFWASQGLPDVHLPPLSSSRCIMFIAIV